MIVSRARGPARRRLWRHAGRAPNEPGRRSAGNPRRRLPEIRFKPLELAVPIRDLTIWFEGPGDRVH